MSAPPEVVEFPEQVVFAEGGEHIRPDGCECRGACLCKLNAEVDKLKQRGEALMTVPARWRWSPPNMRAPSAKRVLFRGPKRLATAWENEDTTWSWRLEGERQSYGPEPDQKSAERAARSEIPAPEAAR